MLPQLISDGSEHSLLERQVFDLGGIVQGVGFRPTLYRLAKEFDLGGSVQNRSGIVRIVLEGSSQKIDQFIGILENSLPEQARLTDMKLVTREALNKEQPGSFHIIESESDIQDRISIPFDLGLCRDCKAEISNPSDRHFRYAFTSCTNCGPRYTVIQGMPYDRERTSLGQFPLCSDCDAEYTNPMDRRFHAESTCCPVCGPQLDYRDEAGNAIRGDAIKQARKDLKEGKIIAVRGLGGFLLAVDAFNRNSLNRLRELKCRPHKPFAVMVPDISSIEQFAILSEAEKTLLNSPRRPIVILEATWNAREELPFDLITPDAATLGIMLPVAPLYQLLMSDPADDQTPAFRMLIMTSGNRRGEPICIRNDEALERLSGIADRFLLHDREVILRNDDSLCSIQLDGCQVWRRARGFAPEPIQLRRPLKRNVLAMGAHLKNTIALGYKDQVVLSPHIGDLDTPEALDSLNEVVKTLPRFLEKTPELVAIDLHPDMHSSRLGRKFAKEYELPLVEVQHHHAHALSCMEESSLEEAIAVVFDGTGLGTDGRIWGGEVFHLEPGAISHLATFSGAPLPGGDTAILRPGRQLFARWIQAGVSVPEKWLSRLFSKRESALVIEQQIQRRLNTPITTAAGRVFDSFSTWLGISPESTTYDGQAAIRLEAIARYAKGGNLPHVPEIRGNLKGVQLEIDWQSFFTELAQLSQPDRADLPHWALAFHVRMAEAAHQMITHARQLHDTTSICLSGGVFMNCILCERLTALLKEDNLRVHIQRQVPPNDGGISFGQVCYVARDYEPVSKLKKEF